MNKAKTLAELDFKDKKVFMRVDFNVPIKDGKIADSHRIEKSLASIRFVLEQGGRLILASHLGRPKSQKESELSLIPVARFLSDVEKLEVLFIEEPESPLPKELLKGLKKNQVILLENLRFHKGEEQKDPQLAKHLSQSIDIYINEGFGISHRDHTSMTLLPELVPEKAIGFQFQKELQHLDSIMSESIKKPFCVVLGGSKLKDKIPLLESLIDRADEFLIGGLMAYTFLKAQGFKVGQTFVQQDFFYQAKTLMDRIQGRKKSLILPVDFTGKTDKGQKETFSREAFPPLAKALDIGPKSQQIFTEKIQKAQTLFWNGPLGYFEDPDYSAGTQAVAQAFIKNKSAYRLVGGGHSAWAVKGSETELDHVSTGGGACLVYLQGKGLPALKSLLS